MLFRSVTDENDLCHLGGWPGPLRPLFGVWAEEIDYLYDDESNHIKFVPADVLPGLQGTFEVRLACDLIHAEGAQVLATYDADFYAGRPALTCNTFGDGTAYYIAARAGGDFLQVFYGALAKKLGLRRALAAELPTGVTAQIRVCDEEEFLFLLNFSRQEQRVCLAGEGWRAMEGDAVTDEVLLAANDAAIRRRPRKA